MKRSITTAFVLAALSVWNGALARGAENELLGEYVEMTTRGVFFGPDREVSNHGIGDFAVLGWSVARGSWMGEDLSGLKVVAAVRIDGSLDELEKSRLRAVLYVDEHADAKQARALRSMAQKLARKYLENIVDVQSAPIALEMVKSAEGVAAGVPTVASQSLVNDGARSGEEASGEVKLEVGKILSVQVRMLDDHAKCACGKSEKEIRSLATTRQRQHATTVKNFFRASGIEIGKNRAGHSQALLGTFSL